MNIHEYLIIEIKSSVVKFHQIGRFDFRLMTTNIDFSIIQQFNNSIIELIFLNGFIKGDLLYI